MEHIPDIGRKELMELHVQKPIQFVSHCNTGIKGLKWACHDNTTRQGDKITSYLHI